MILNLKEKKQEAMKRRDLSSQKKDAAQIAKEQKQRLKNLDVTSEKRLKDLNRQVSRQRVPVTSQKTIQYNRMFENGICEVTEGLYSKTIQFADINYQSVRDEDKEDVFAKYCEMINYIDPLTPMQINVINRKVDEKLFAHEMLIPLQGNKQDVYRKEMNAMLLNRVQEGNNGILHEKFVTISVFADTYRAAVTQLAKHEANLIGFLQNIGCSSYSLTGRERLQLLHTQLRPGEDFIFDYKDLLYSNLTTKDYICPVSFDFSAPSNYAFDEKFGQTIFLRDYPAELSDNLIAALTELPFDLNISLHIQGVDQTVALDYVRKQIAFMDQQKIDEQKKAFKSGYDIDMISTELTDSMEEAKILLHNLQKKDQRMFKVTLLVNTFADDEEELADHVFDIISTAKTKANGCLFKNLDFRQEDALNSALPLGIKLIEIERTLTTASTAILIPFTSQELYQAKGIYYGLNKISRNLIFFNRRNLDAPNGFILAQSGYGKSFAAKREIAGVLLGSNDEVIILDPEREYEVFTAKFGGEHIKISAGSPHHINPMDLNADYGGDENPLLLKSEFMLYLCKIILGDISPAEESILDRVCRITYEPFFSNMKKNEAPTLKDFHRNLSAIKMPEAQHLALSLEHYVEGSLQTFAHPTNVNTQNRLVTYDIKDLGKPLRTLGLLVVLDQIWNRITSNRKRGVRTWFYTDEFQLVTANAYAEQYYFELWSRARKWGAIPTAITQNVETLLLSDTARRMLSNSNFIMLLNQSYSDRVELAKLLSISAEQQKYITNVRPGEGLLFAQRTVVPFQDDFPKETELYNMMTTKLNEKF